MRGICLQGDDSVDELVWHYRKNGIFPIKTAYHMWVYKLHSESVACTSIQSKSKRIWGKIWSIKVQPRIGNLLWRACKGVLSCKANLKRQRVVEDDECHCRSEKKDEMHVLFHCLEARKVWGLAPNIRLFGVSSSTIMDFFEGVLDKLPKVDVQI